MAVDFLGALGAGADIDSNSLVESLVAAERAPKEILINRKIDQSEAEISGYGILMASLQSLDTAFQSLNDAKDFAEYSVSVADQETSSGSASFSLSATADAVPGSTTVKVTALANEDRWGSDATYASLTTSLNGGATFNITVTDAAGAATAVAVTTTTPQGVVDKINEANLGVTASVMDTGGGPGPYKIVLASEVGTANGFSVSTSASSGTALAFGDRLSTAANASVEVNGVTITRSTNTITDVIDGVTLNLSGITAGTGMLTVAQTTDPIKTRINDLVTVYNAVHTQLDMLTDSESTEELGGTLSGDGGFANIVRHLENMFSSASSTATGNISYLAEIGVEFDRYGKLEVDSDRLDVALVDNFTDIVSIFTADTDNQSNVGDANRGIAGDAIARLAELMANDGAVTTRVSNLESRVSDYKESLENLDRRMQSIQSRYIKQFSAMEMAVDAMNSTRSFLESTLKNLPFNNRD
ncbi:flagellar filament capping protein FliD [Litorivicinus sp.]|nr:flagellar filament capping protein FliD [Litorivicinus sp.]MDB9862130.1 flagellar filament capping protein FliD [Litorivicinus sp.]